MKYKACDKRYDVMPYNRTGESGLYLPALSLGLWHNFSHKDNFKNMTEMITTAFDLGITHFDLANNYGRPYAGSAEENFGKILKNEMASYRDELIISTKAGYYMHPGPYGDGGSRKYLMSSLDASLKRMGLDYVDIFYSHRMDKNTPLEETLTALCDIVKSGKALYVGISNYDASTTKKAQEFLESKGVHCLIHQVKFSMLDQTVLETGVLDATSNAKMGSIAFSPLAQGLLSDKYLKGIPKSSRAANPDGFLQKEAITKDVIEKIKALNEIAKNRGETLSQMAINWILNTTEMTSVLIGASSAKQIKENAKAINQTDFSAEELEKINKILNGCE